MAIWFALAAGSLLRRFPLPPLNIPRVYTISFHCPLLAVAPNHD